MRKRAPSNFLIHGRSQNIKAHIQNQNVFFQPMIGRLNILDPETQKKRRTTLTDVADLIRVADALPYYTLLHSGAIMPHIEGIQDSVAHLHGYYVSVKNTSKIVKGTCRGTAKAADCIRMASIIAWMSTSPSEWPTDPFSWAISSPPIMSFRPFLSRWMS